MTVRLLASSDSNLKRASLGPSTSSSEGRSGCFFPRVRSTLIAAVGTALSFGTATADAPSKAFQLEEATIADIRQAFDAGTLTSKRLVEMYLARIAAYEDGGPMLNSIITINPKALEIAAALDAERKAKGARGPLHGIPVLLKDNVDTFDLPTTNGSAILKLSIPPDDAHLAKALRDAGAIVLGKTAMGEFAGGSYNSVSGQAVNPYHFKRHTGGSSSGSGAAIAANFAVLAVGTDTSTSVRGPAAYNGIVGIRPTTGLISRDGIAPKNLNFDSAGPMARTVTDVAHMLSVIAGPDPADPLSMTVWSEVAKRNNGKTPIDYTKYLDRNALKNVRLGVVRDFFGGDPEVDALATAALGKMKSQGATTVDIQLDADFVAAYLGEGNRTIRRLSDYRFRDDWEKYLATLGAGTPKSVAQFVDIYETVVKKSPLPVEDSVMNLLTRSLATSTDDPEYKNLIENVLPRATRAKLALFEKYKVDALVFPYFSSFAPPISNPAFKVDDATFVDSGKPQPATLAGYSSVGFPSIVVPMGFGSQGLPGSMTFFGRPYEEGRLISYAYAYEQASQLRRPSPLLPPLAAR
jgi:amidase